MFPTTDPVGNFTDALCTIANSTIPKSKSKPVKLNTIWFNDECKEVIKSRKKLRENLIPKHVLLILKNTELSVLKPDAPSKQEMAQIFFQY